ncbi:hypothetical protein AJ81_10510 [Pseudothermotoga hypogea DSM 11164 = NBRC 106472]|uniref:Uncharacterized protein n=1 Tax=Pseudothermotoga hypogea DSM 11164 = NBRC 106472 TaxID=1123384 RepID=A0A0X1KUJ0_9THEM|nr:hypothetical protein AJ81_10510 [Pseudothermotoga hypogea DSM 11164 = NBRC 106472]
MREISQTELNTAIKLDKNARPQEWGLFSKVA